MKKRIYKSEPQARISFPAGVDGYCLLLPYQVTHMSHMGQTMRTANDLGNLCEFLHVPTKRIADKSDVGAPLHPWHRGQAARCQVPARHPLGQRHHRAEDTCAGVGFRHGMPRLPQQSSHTQTSAQSGRLYLRDDLHVKPRSNIFTDNDNSKLKSQSTDIAFTKRLVPGKA